MPRNYYLDATLFDMCDSGSCEDISEAKELLKQHFFRSGKFSTDDLLELLCRGVVHAHADERTERRFDLDV